MVNFTADFIMAEIRTAEIITAEFLSVCTRRWRSMGCGGVLRLYFFPSKKLAFFLLLLGWNCNTSETMLVPPVKNHCNRFSHYCARLAEERKKKYNSAVSRCIPTSLSVFVVSYENY